MGLDVEKKDLKDKFKDFKANEAAAVQASAELTDEQVEGVAGGFAASLADKDGLADIKKLASRQLATDDDLTGPILRSER